jgi:NAD(P)-dependent dehydrogenase (short-subunit alcohol dehydrogenase family)
MISVKNEVVIITGVSGNLGSEYCNYFLQNEAYVIGVDISKNSKIDLIEKKNNEKFKFFQIDITNSKNIESSIKAISSVFGNPTVLINNAAIDSPPNAPLEENGPFEEYPESSWDKVMDVNLKSVFLMCKYFGAIMAQNNKGSIINISSIYGVVSPDQSIYDYRRNRDEIYFKPVAYSVSKSAIMNLTRYLAVYWAKKSVRVNTLVISGVYNEQEKEFVDAYSKRIPIGRMADRQEFNGALLFLASDASKYMTGSSLTIDGGWTAI